MILCITHSQDFYTVDLFFEYLSSKNIPFYRLNSDELNHSQKINVSPNSFTITDLNGNTIYSKDIKAVWHRKAWRVKPPEDLDESFSDIFISEYETLKTNLFTLLEHLPWINPLENEKKIDANKMLQLSIAEKNGLKIPETLFSNDEVEIRNFLNEKCSAKAVAKLHGVLSKNMSGENMVSTMIISQSNIENLSDVIYSPMIFQPYIEKEYELRIVYLDGEFFAGKINNSENADWRVTQENYFWSVDQLPQDIEMNLTSMMKEMGLYFGAIDMIKSTDGAYYFLEVNPQGEWGMLQKELGFPVAERIADHLLKRIEDHEE